jgi:septum formation protein
VAAELALGKALEVADQFPDSIVIGSDTIVTVSGKQLEKPRDAEEAQAMLTMLSGTHNDVTTGVAVVQKSTGTQYTDVDTTRVYFKPYDEAAVRQYVASGDPFDKAGGYGIQSGAAPLVDHIEGHYDTVIGLPTHVLARLLRQAGIKSRPVDLACPVPQQIV